LASTNATEANVRFLAGLSPSAPATRCAIAFGEISGWQFPRDTAASLAPGVPTALDVRIVAPAGAKGFFRLPADVTYSGDGWSLTCRTALRTLTQNRLCQWVASTGGQPWQPVTNTTVHGAMDLTPWLGTCSTGTTVTAVAVLSVTRPTPLRFEFEGPIQLTVDGTRIGTDIQRGTRGNTALAPGDHLLKVLFTLKKKSECLLKVSCETADTCLPGDLTVLPSEAVLRSDALTKEGCKR